MVKYIHNIQFPEYCRALVDLEALYFILAKWMNFEEEKRLEHLQILLQSPICIQLLQKKTTFTMVSQLKCSIVILSSKR